MKVKLLTNELETREVDNIRQKIEECADGIVDYISEQVMMQRIYDDFGHDLHTDQAEKLANIVYSRLKDRL
tara:strand:+ start:78 stop:290 length:213 start_codon:yes stop_codon:yes gene_type:complete